MRKLGLVSVVVSIIFVAACTDTKKKDDKKPEPVKSQEPAKKPEPGRDDAGARTAFLECYKVFVHPRCLNCHPAGDVPLQGDDSHPHGQGVKRGKDGRGVPGMKCSSCHQDANFPGEHTPPGNPNWHLPPPETPLVFQGVSARDLAEQLKDPKKNGGRTLAQVVEHVTTDSLVLEGWTPGEGRSLPPLSHDDFARAFKDWVDKGAASPE